MIMDGTSQIENANTDRRVIRAKGLGHCGNETRDNLSWKLARR